MYRWLLAFVAAGGCGNDRGLMVDAGGPPGSPTITVTSPRPSQSFYPAESVTITWIATDDGAATVTCDVAASAGGSAIPVAMGVIATSGVEASTTWSLASVASATYRAEIACTDADGLTGAAVSPTFVVSGPPQAVSYTTIQDIFTQSCNRSGCHNATSRAGELNLTASASYAALYDVTSADCATTKRVKPGAPDESYLVHKLQGSGPCFLGSRMPKGAPALSATQMQSVRDWIANGALAN